MERLGDLFRPVLTKVQKLPFELRRYFEQEKTQRPAENDALQPYMAKRDFTKTGEPRPGRAAGAGRAAAAAS
jgi:hypothetical protein